MNIDDFIQMRPFLYHLTDSRNITNIIASKTLLSTANIVDSLPDKELFLSTRRIGHAVVNSNGFEIHIRDQRPISERVLRRSLTDNWTVGEFLNYLNKRVFFWPTMPRLVRHFNRYQDENPVILRFNTEEVFKTNPYPFFSHLNSGATRCHSKWGGNAPARGPHTFLSAMDYLRSPSTVAEVTFIGYCNLPNLHYRGDNPQGPWQLHST